MFVNGKEILRDPIAYESDAFITYPNGQIESMKHKDWIEEKTSQHPIETGGRQIGRIACGFDPEIDTQIFWSREVKFNVSFADVNRVPYIVSGRWNTGPFVKRTKLYPGISMDDHPPTNKVGLVSSLKVAFAGELREIINGEPPN